MLHLDVVPSIAIQLARGIVIGLGAAVPIGPVNVQIARRALRDGFAAGVALGLGAVSVDVTYASLSCLSLGPLLDHRAVKWPLSVGGIVLLTYLGVQCLAAGWTKNESPIDDATASTATPSRRSLRSGYLLGLMMTFLNPMTLMFWFVALPALAGPISSGGARELMLMCVGVFAGTLAWVLFFSGALSILGGFRRNLWLFVADTAGGATLLFFAGALLLRSIRTLL